MARDGVRRWWWLVAVAAATGAVVGARTLGWSALHWSVPLTALVVLAAGAGSYGYARALGSAQTRVAGELADGQQRIGGGSVDVSAHVLVETAGRQLRSTDVEMVLLGPDGPVHYTGDGATVARRRVDPDAFDRPWVLRALGRGGVRTGVTAGRPYCSVAIGSFSDLTGPLAVLVARRPTGAPRFGRRDARVIWLLGSHAERWFSTGVPLALAGAFGPRGAVDRAAAAADPAPDLTLLRDSARRLSSLASGPAGPAAVGHIIGELHAAERAVASLLGALALTTVGEFSDDAGRGSATGQRAVEEWTTTGVLSRPAS